MLIDPEPTTGILWHLGTRDLRPECYNPSDKYYALFIGHSVFVGWEHGDAPIHKHVNCAACRETVAYQRIYRRQRAARTARMLDYDALTGLAQARRQPKVDSAHAWQVQHVDAAYQNW